jgi:hypothetical protein
MLEHPNGLASYFRPDSVTGHNENV